MQIIKKIIETTIKKNKIVVKLTNQPVYFFQFINVASLFTSIQEGFNIKLATCF